MLLTQNIFCPSGILLSSGLASRNIGVNRTAGAGTSMTRLERFWSKVNKNTESGCWEWNASKDRHGYGQFGILYGTYLSHRISYELMNGSIPAGLEIDHLCRNHGCVNPNHLQAVTHRENVMRGNSALRRPWQLKDKCKSGHALTSDNIRLVEGGNVRECRKCKRIRALKNRIKNGQIRRREGTADLDVDWLRDNDGLNLGREDLAHAQGSVTA